MKGDKAPLLIFLPRPNRQSAENLLAKLRKLQRGSNLVLFHQPCLACCAVPHFLHFLAGNMFIHTSAKPHRNKVDAAREESDGTHFDLNLSFMQGADHLIILPLRLEGFTPHWDKPPTGTA